MRIAVFNDNGFRRAGVVQGWGDDAVISPLPADTDVLQLLEDRAGDEWVLAAADEPVPLSRVRLLAPVLPPTVRDFVTFEEHVEGVRRSIDGETGVAEQWYAAPTFYFGNPYSIIGPVDDVPMPPWVGHSRTWLSTPPAVPGGNPVTCWHRAPAGTAGAWQNYGDAMGLRNHRR